MYNNRLLMYDSNNNKYRKQSYQDYGKIETVITDKLVNVSMDGTDYILEAVPVANGYIPRLGDWVVIEWSNGQPTAKGGKSDTSGGLADINAPTVVSQSQLASGTINSDHIRTDSIESRHIQAGSITAEAISANSITGDRISANTITGANIASGTITSDNIKTGSLLGTDISANSITAVQLGANSVTAYQISANAVQTQHISANSIMAYQIGVDQVNASHISANSITSDEIQANAVQAQHISANSVQSSQISANAVQTQHISANSITTSQIQAGAITTSLLSASSVTTDRIQANAVQAQNISANAVQTQHISANTITTSQIKAGAITTSLISANSITTNLIQAGAITTSTIQAGAITSSLITANAIQTQHISANTITTSQIQANAITSNLISANAIQTQHISANTITTSQIQANAITSNLITANAIQGYHISANSITGGLIQANTISGGNIMSNTITAQNIQAGAITTSALSANSITSDKIQAGAITSNLITANAIQSYHISANQVQTQHISANTIVGGQIQANTITGQNIQAGSISGTSIASNTITAVNLAGSSVTSYQISANAVQTQHISANSVMANQIGANQINATHISANSVTTPAISANSITTDKIQANAIQAQNISANAIQTQHISANTLTAGMFQANSVTSSAISANTIYTAHIQAGVITSALISANAVQTQHISANTITTGQIQAGAITTALISANTINAGLIQANAIQTYHINANAITSNLISANAVQTQHISANSITTAQIQVGAITTSLISANTITSSLIQANAIQTQHISSNTITTSQIQAGAITSALISANAVQTQHISANTITTAQIQAGAITSSLISANAIQSQHIGASVITGTMIQAGTISANNIASNAIQTQHISANTIVGSQIQANQINASHITANAVTSTQISANAVQSQHISANAVQTQHISANSITTAQIQAGAITTNLITANAITSALITANAIQSVHISASAVTSSQISANAVQSQHISANAVQTQHISANTITSAMIKAGAITSNLITANAITTNLIGANQIMGFQISANQISGNHIVANSIQTSHIQANAITSSLITANAIQAQHVSASAITSVAISANAVQSQHISANSILANMISANQVNSTHISANSILSNMISANQVQAQHISANSVQTQHISANTIQGYQIQANQISGNHIVAGTISANQLAVGTVQQGLLGQYYTYSAGATNKFQNFKGSQIDPTINFSWGSGAPSIVGQSDYFAVRWQGFIAPPETGQYSFTAIADDTFKLIINGTQIFNITAWTSGNEVTGNTISLTQGTWYPFLAEFSDITSTATAILKWVRPSLIKEVIPSMYLTQGNTQIDGAQIMTGTITASSMQVGTITASSGILATASIQTANIADGTITSAKIGNGEIQTVNIASGNITNALIADSTITHSKILSVDAGTITVGQLNGAIIQAGTISGNQIAAQSITADRLQTGAIDSVYIKAGAVITSTIASGAITTDKIQAGAVTGDIIRAGSITAEHISTIGLDAQLVQVYNGLTGETLVGGGYLRVDGLDVGVVQSDNLIANGLFLASSSDYGFKRMNPSGEALLGNTVTGVGSHQVWKIDLTSGSVVKTIDVPAKKPFDIAIHPSGNYAYITVQGDDTLIQLDVTQDTLTQHVLSMGMGPARAKFVGDILEDHKHVFVLNTDPDDMNIPDSLMVIDTPPSSVNGDLYLHHQIVLGNNPYDFIVDSGMFTYVTMASEGDIVMIDSSGHDSHLWKVKGRIPISAFGTDNMHGDLPSTYGLQEVTGGDASGQYNDNMSSSMMSGMGGMDTAMGYGTSDGSLRTYEPHGIVQSSDPNTLYVVDYANGELVVVDKYGNAPYNALIGTTAQGSYQGSNVSSSSSPASLGSSEDIGGGPGTYYVRYRIPVGDSPDFIQLVNGKLFITLQGTGNLAVIDEQQIINEINSDNAYYGTKNSDGTYTNWNVFQPMRTVNPFTVRTISNVGASPSLIKALGNNLYVSLSNQAQVAVIDTIGEKVTKYINVGTNPKGFDFTPDGRYMYVANYGGIGDLSFIYPQGSYIGDPFMALEGGIMYQGADGWTPDRSNWVFDASGNIQSKSTVEFHINEPLKNEGGYAKLTAYGIDSQYAQIEQDIINVENYSNGNNIVVVTGGRLIGNLDGSVWTPKEGTFISGSVSNVMIASVVSGSTILTSANASQYTVSYSQSQIMFSANVVGSGNWVQANYSSPNNIYFKTHNSSVEIAVDNGSSPNFFTSFQVDEYVPNFVAVDNRQTSSFTPTADGISDTYEGLEYSVMTNRSPNSLGSSSQAMGVSADLGSSTFDYTLITSGHEPDQLTGNTTGNTTPTSSGNITLTGNAWVQLDLQNTYMVGKISVSHMYGADRVYHNTKTQVSEDGTNWITVFDSAVSGEYNEKPYYDSMNNVTNYAHMITFNALPVRYVRDYANGWASGNGTASGNTSDWTQINVYGDWEVEKGYTYPSNSTMAGKQIATNGIGFVSTDISKAYVAMNVQINFTSWWWMTYIVGPNFGRIKIEMPTLMNSGHFLNQQAPFVNNVAHRHIMSFPPSMMVQGNSMNGIESGKHRVIIRQDSGKVTLDRLRFDDFQYYNRSVLSIPSQNSPATFTRYKVIAEQAKWYQGKGRQSTEGAYDTPRTNPDTGAPDYSVPIKYRVRVLSQLSPTGNVQERGTIYVTSAIFETGKQSTHWRRSEASDVFAGSKIEQWNPSQPHNTGIQSGHLANGSVRGTKILANTIMDYHISNYARIQEHKLELNYPTHEHTNKAVLDTIVSWAGTSGNYGTGNTMARGDHAHDGSYLSLITGGTVVGGTTVFNNGINSYKESHFGNGGYSDPAVGIGFGLKVSQGIATDKLNVSGSVTVTGNITVTGTVDGVDVSALNTSYGQTSANVTNHIGSGGSAHALVTSGSAGFMSSSDKIKLDAIQSSSINQTTADGMYARLSGNNLNNTVVGKLIEHGSNSLILGNNDWTPLIYYTIGTPAYYNASYKGVTLSGGSTWVKVRTRLPIDPESTYFVRAKVTKHSGSGTVYIGADTLDSNYNSLQTDQATSYNYFGASGVTIPSGSSQYFESTISGYNATNGNSPHMFDPSGNYFDLVLIGNYNGSGETTFEWVELYKAPNTGYIGSSLIATQPWVSSNYYTQSYLNGVLVDATESTHGFISTSDKIKLDGIQSSSINQTTADGRYLQLSGGSMLGDLILNGQLIINQFNAGIQFKNSAFDSNGYQWWHGPSGSGDNVLLLVRNGTGNSNYTWKINGTDTVWTTATLGTDPATKTWISGNYYNTSTIDGKLVDATETVHGFMSTADKIKLDGIQSSSINQTTADGRYLQLTGGTVTGDFKASGRIYVLNGPSDVNGGMEIGRTDGVVATPYIDFHTGSGNDYDVRLIASGGLISGNGLGSLDVRAGNMTVNSNSVWHKGTLADPATQTWISGNYYNQSYLNSVLVDATETTHGFMSTADKIKLDGIQSSSISQSTADNRYLQLTGGALSGALSVTGNITTTGTYNGINIVNLNNSYNTTSGNVTAHIGSGGSAHAVAISGGSNGFIDGANYGKLLRIQDNAINLVTADSRYYIQNQSVYIDADNNFVGIDTGAIRLALYKKAGYGPAMAVSSGNQFNIYEMNTNDLSQNITGTSVRNTLLTVGNSTFTYMGNSVATQPWVTGNYYTQSYLNSVLVDATESVHGFMSVSDKVKIDGIQSNAINQTTADGRYLNISGGALSGSLSVTGNITTTGTVNGVDVSGLNTTVNNHIGSGGSAHAVAISGGANGFIDGANYGKLLRIQDNAINQSSADGRYLQLAGGNLTGNLTFSQNLIRAGGSNNNSLVLGSVTGGAIYLRPNGDTSTDSQFIVASGSATFNGYQLWQSGNLPDPATKTWISGNYYNTATVDQKVASRGDVFQANANIFTTTNTFNNAGLGIKVQPSGSVANTTKLIQVNDTNSNELFSVNYSGGVSIAGDLSVTGVQKFSGTTTVDGDYTVSGNMYVSGNSTLGGQSTDTTTVNGTLVVNGNIHEVGYYQEVHRRPLFGIAGDLQFQTNDTTYDSVVYNYDPTGYALPAVQTGATRYYRLYIIYSDDINSSQLSGGQLINLMYSSNAGTMTWNPNTTWGGPTNRRDWYTPYFTGLPTGHSTIYASLAQSGNNLGIRWIELIAYDKF